MLIPLFRDLQVTTEMEYRTYSPTKRAPIFDFDDRLQLEEWAVVKKVRPVLCNGTLSIGLASTPMVDFAEERGESGYERYCGCVPDGSASTRFGLDLRTTATFTFSTEDDGEGLDEIGEGNNHGSVTDRVWFCLSRIDRTAILYDFYVDLATRHLGRSLLAFDDTVRAHHLAGASICLRCALAVAAEWSRAVNYGLAGVGGALLPGTRRLWEEQVECWQGQTASQGDIDGLIAWGIAFDAFAVSAFLQGKFLLAATLATIGTGLIVLGEELDIDNEAYAHLEFAISTPLIAGAKVLNCCVRDRPEDCLTGGASPTAPCWQFDPPPGAGGCCDDEVYYGGRELDQYYAYIGATANDESLEGGRD